MTPRAADCYDPELRAGGVRAAVLPVGSLEQHGAHLPVSTDSDIVTEVSRRVSEACGFLLLPTMPYGVSYEHAPMFQLSVSEGTLRAAVCDVCASLADWGVRTAFVINGHHGNQGALRGVGDEVRDRTGGRLEAHALAYWRFMGREFDHAGFAETSLMLAVPGRVRMERAERGLVTDGMPEARVRELEELAARSFPEATGNGVWGDPAGATAAGGEDLLGELAENLSQACLDRLGGRA